ncbi:flippase [Halococcus salifodinae]|uniref:Membrane protein involved in the export of O-antigen and teichoic acid n=1 Tax=Halococcus salifodinae DSM 8989 TaxID=1227456 RepID=M0N2R5_9EURY|nr:flippase [Halococcus salifodinae]EMA52237.1 membrane protein involved in the export of O-antigen and teichoic acid [Halococcus salifodinae DSM 8989]
MNLERTSLILFVSSVASKILGFVGSVYFARELGPEIIGIFALVQAVIGMLGVPADFGVQGAAEKRITETNNQIEKNRLFTASIVILVVAFIVVVLLLFVFRGFVVQYIGEPLVIELSVILFLTILYQLLTAVLRAEFKIEQTAAIDVVKNTVRVAISIGLILLGYGIYALITGLMASMVIGLGASVLVLGLGIARPERDHFRSLYEFSKYNVILRTSGLIYTWIDTLMIGFFLTQSLVGVYEVAWTLTGVVVLASKAVSQTLFPNFSQFVSNDNLGELERTLPKAISYSLLIPIPAFFGVLLLSQDILSIIYGSAFSAGWLVLILLTGERVIHSVHTVIYKTLLAFDRPDVAFRISGLTMVLNGVLNAILIPQIGIAGAASAFVISYLVNSIIYYYYVSQRVPIALPSREIGWMLLSSIVMSVVVYLIRESYSITTVPELSLIIGIAVIAYCLMMLGNSSIRRRIFSKIDRSFDLQYGRHD